MFQKNQKTDSGRSINVKDKDNERIRKTIVNSKLLLIMLVKYTLIVIFNHKIE